MHLVNRCRALVIGLWGLWLLAGCSKSATDTILACSAPDIQHVLRIHIGAPWMTWLSRRRGPAQPT